MIPNLKQFLSGKPYKVSRIDDIDLRPATRWKIEYDDTTDKK